MKRSYDLVFSLGMICASSAVLRRAGLQFSSFPFDWNKGDTLLSRVQALGQDFGSWCALDNLRFVKESNNAVSDTYEDIVSHVFFPHDFPKGVPVAESYSAVAAKYTRRIERLNHFLETSSRVLAVWVDGLGNPPVQDVEIDEAKKALSAKYPGRTIDLLVFRCQRGISMNDCEIQVLPSGALLVAFDYAAEEKPGDIARFALNTRRLAKWMAHRFVAVDYRSAAERRAWREAEQAKRYRKFHAGTWRGMVLHKLAYKLYGHLYKYLKRAGFDAELTSIERRGVR